VEQEFLPTRVIEAVETALRAEPIPYVAANPPPDCSLCDLKEGESMNYAVHYWLTEFGRTDATDSVVRIRIFAALRRANIPFSIPTQSLLLTEQNASYHESRETREMDQKIRTLEKLDLFKSLTAEERIKLAAGLESTPFVRGETIIRQGTESHCLYILIEGEAEIQVSVDGHTRTVAGLRAVDFFGEMGVLTGDPRFASVIAKTDTRCYRLGKLVLEEILQQRPEIAEQMAGILALRREALNIVREQTGEEAARLRIANTQVDLLNRIRDFFKLAGTR
jgi:CRP-like cAMP-binding protein